MPLHIDAVSLPAVALPYRDGVHSVDEEAVRVGDRVYAIASVLKVFVVARGSEYFVEIEYKNTGTHRFLFTKEEKQAVDLASAIVTACNRAHPAHPITVNRRKDAPFSLSTMQVVFIALLALLSMCSLTLRNQGNSSGGAVARPTPAAAANPTATAAAVAATADDVAREAQRPTPTPVPTRSNEGRSLARPAGPGQWVRAGDVLVGVVEALRPAHAMLSVENRSYGKSDPGFEYLVITINAGCTKSNDETCAIGPSDFSVVADDGSEFPAFEPVGIARALELGRFAGGSTLQQKLLVFRVPQDRRRFILKYVEGLIFRNEVYVDFASVTRNGPASTDVIPAAEAPESAAAAPADAGVGSQDPPAEAEAAVRAICGARFKSAYYSTDDYDGLMARCEVSDGFTNDAIVEGAVEDFLRITKTMYELRPELDYLVVQLTGRFKGSKGDVTEQPAFTFTMTKELYRTADWSGVPPREAARLLAAQGEDAVAVNPGFQADWRDYLR